MKPLQKIIKFKEEHEFYLMHLNIIGAFIPVELTKKEREVLSHFMCFKGQLAETNLFNTEHRKIVKKKMNNMSDAGLTNYITTLRQKEILVENKEGSLKIKEYLFPSSDKVQIYQFKIIKE